LPELDVVTGAFSYTGRAIAERLLAGGRAVRTLTRRVEELDPLAGRIESAPLQFADVPALVAGLRGADTLYNTYWIRFPRGDTTFERAVANTRALFAAAADAGVRRIVHVSVTNPAEDSPLPYFRGKARLERDLRASGLSHAIVRPTLVFGPKDILVNNIAWVLRRFPLFLVPGRGDYPVQPVSLEDTARIAVEAGAGKANVTLDAAGPDTMTFTELVAAVRAAVRGRARIVHAPPSVALRLSELVGRALGDVMLTREEIAGLMDGLLVSREPPRGRDSFTAWLESSGDALGAAYVSELERNFRPYAPV
jgi:NADH dehydrogenase